MSVDNITQAVAVEGARLLRLGRTSVEDIVSCVHANHPMVVARHQRRLVDEAIRRQVKSWFRNVEEADDGEDVAPTLPGMGFPRAIAVPKVIGEGYYYVAVHEATWAELAAGREQRYLNVQRAEDALSAYDAEMERVRSVMESDPSLTYGAACVLINDLALDEFELA